eukprot:TRINITY_DN3203_c0_g1_i1.p1 TRINITY_DN3203_c0_g1~~TRINITY_DN3203_c0_g1_i1.p1  ORF type:complete len:308 (+),score=44.81 TRINITY_DN3203_c0_g1_i1:68-991(+)
MRDRMEKKGGERCGVLVIRNASGKVLATLQDLPLSSTVAHLKEELAHKKYHLCSRDRQSLFVIKAEEKVYLKDDQTLAACGMTENENVIYFKDLGFQVAWRTVFLVEYAGPLLIYLMFYFQLPYFTSAPHTYVQQLACLCWVGHYAKRELETIFVHRFSKGTMPLLNIFKNSGYYWGFGALCGYFVNSPDFVDPSISDAHMGFAFFWVCELGNLITHIKLRNLRPPGTTTRQIPRGFLFEEVSCPNYLCEILAWLSFSFMTHSYAALMFTAVGAYQMLIWALQKHARYQREFPDYPAKRRALIPYLL